MILVVGGTGSLGGKIVDRLVAEGESVRVLARPTSHSSPLREAGVEVVIGDLTDAPTLAPACEGATVVITTASATRRGDDSPENVDQRGSQNLIDAAQSAGVDRFVFTSTIGASADSPVPAFRAKGIAEEHLRNSGIDYAILHANAFMDVWFGMMIEMPIATGQPVTLVGESRRRHSFIAERDLAAFAIAAARHPAARNNVLTLGGPEPLTFRDVVAAYEEALGRPIAVRSVDPGAPIPGLPEPVWGIAAALETFDSPIPMEETARVYGVPLTSAREFARQSNLAAVAR
jgi:NADH dehydrogenase